MNNRFCNFFRSFCPRRGRDNDDLRQPFLNRVAINGPLQDEEKIPQRAIARPKKIAKEPKRLIEKKRCMRVIEEALRIVENPSFADRYVNASILWSILLLWNAGMVFLLYITVDKAVEAQKGYDNFSKQPLPKLNYTCSSISPPMPGYSDMIGTTCSQDHQKALKDFAKNASTPINCSDIINNICAMPNWLLGSSLGFSIATVVDCFFVREVYCYTNELLKDDLLPADLSMSKIAKLEAAAQICGFYINNKNFLEVRNLLEDFQRKLQRSIEHDIYFKRVLVEDELKEILVPDVLPVIFEYANLNEPDELRAIRVDDLEPDEEKHSAAAARMGM